jgi:Kef-type K+ transport system membrane component KefB
MAFELYHRSQRTVGRLLTLVVITILAALFRFLVPLSGMGAATMLLGFLLLAAYVAGELSRDFRLPRITGYLIIGILCGPHLLGLLPQEIVDDFRLINGVALSVIALQAGGELRLDRLRPRIRSISAITVLQIVIISLGTAVVVYLARDMFPFLDGHPPRTALAVALIFGLVAVAKSPATTIAVITELRAKGPLTDTVLGVSVLKDVLLLLMVAVVVPAAVVLADPGGGFDFEQLSHFALGMGLSLSLGAAVGGLISIYLSKLGQQPILFVLAVAFGVVELTRVLGFDSEFYILMSMAAGFVVQNFSVHGPRFVEALEANSLPLYALFFAVAGADLDLGVIPAVWKAGLLLILVRAMLILASTYLGARAARDLAPIRRYAWMGFLAQAGVTLGLATIVRDRFGEWGGAVAAIIIAMIAVNQLIGPPLFRHSLVRAQEARSL